MSYNQAQYFWLKHPRQWRSDTSYELIRSYYTKDFWGI